MYGHYFIPSIRMELKGFYGTDIEEHVISEFKRLQVEYGNIWFQFYENDLKTIAKFVHYLTIIYPQIPTKIRLWQYLGQKHNTV